MCAIDPNLVLMQTASQPFAQCLSGSSPSTGALHFSLDDGFLKAFVSYGMAEELHFLLTVGRASSLLSVVEAPTHSYACPSKRLTAAVYRVHISNAFILSATFLEMVHGLLLLNKMKKAVD